MDIKNKKKYMKSYNNTTFPIERKNWCRQLINYVVNFSLTKLPKICLFTLCLVLVLWNKNPHKYRNIKNIRDIGINNRFNNTREERPLWNPIYEPSYQITRDYSLLYPYKTVQNWNSYIYMIWEEIIHDPYRNIEPYYDLFEEIFPVLPNCVHLFDKLNIEEWRVVLGYCIAGVMSWEDYKSIYCSINPEYLQEMEKPFSFKDKCINDIFLYQMNKEQLTIYSKQIKIKRKNAKNKTFTELLREARAQ